MTHNDCNRENKNKLCHVSSKYVVSEWKSWSFCNKSTNISSNRHVELNLMWAIVMSNSWANCSFEFILFNDSVKLVQKSFRMIHYWFFFSYLFLIIFWYSKMTGKAMEILFTKSVGTLDRFKLNISKNDLMFWMIK